MIEQVLCNYSFPIYFPYKIIVPLCRKLSTEELMLLNCGVGEDS